MASPIRIEAASLRAFIARVFQHFEVPPDDAQVAADVLVRADLRGIESHGIIKLWQYTDPLCARLLNPRPQIRTLFESPATATLDGDFGLGMVVGVRAMERCITKAQAHGVGVVAVQRSKHFGIASYYEMMGLPCDMIGLSLTNNSGPGVVPTF